MKRTSFKRTMLSMLFSMCVIMASNLYAATPWTSLPSGTSEQINSIFVVKNNTDILYACGRNATLLKSIDSGASWTTLSSAITGAELNSIFFVDANNGYAVGDAGTMLKTINGGTSWTTLSAGTIQDINDLVFFDANTGIIVANNGIILKTVNAGLSWTQNNEGVFPEDYYAISSASANQAYVCGENGAIRFTSNGGTSWTSQQSGSKSYNLYDIECNSNGKIFAVGSAGTILFSGNNGQSGYSVINSGLTETLYACEISPKGEVVYFAGENGRILNSMNDGISLTSIEVGNNKQIRSIAFYTNEAGFIAGADGFIAKTATGGTSNGLYELTLTKPVVGEMLVNKKSIEISWTSRNVENVSISYRLNDSDSWRLIATVANANTYSWLVPEESSDKCKIMLVDDDDNAADYILSGYFQIFTPTMHLLSPNGGEHWRNRANANIAWEGAQGDTVKLEYSIDNGTTWLIIANAVYAAHGTYTWTVPVLPSAKALVRVSDKNNPLNVDISDLNFSILGVKLQSFQGGGEYLYKTKRDILWDAVGVETLNILYSIDDGITWNKVAEEIIATTGKYSWDIPNNPSMTTRLRLIDPSNSQYSDISQQNFGITGVLLTSPTGGETWKSGTKENITWAAADINKVCLKYSTNGGADWITIHSAVDAANSSYQWLVPKTDNPTTIISISDIATPTVKNVSDDFYILNESGIVVTAPANNNIWKAGETRNIKWASINVIALDIDISFDNGMSWNNIANGVLANQNTYAWAIPNNIKSSIECIIRLTDSENEDVLAISDGLFRMQNGLYQVPNDWGFKNMTGESSVIIVPHGLQPKIGEINLQQGDVIGIFYNYDDTSSTPTHNGLIKCAGRGVWADNTNNLSITVWGDNSRTDDKDGFDMNEKYQVKVWDATRGIEYDVYTEYSGKNYFLNNGISVITVFTTYQIQSIHLPAKVWSLFSTNLRPIDSDIKEIMSDIVVDMDYMKNEEGEVYDPINNVDNIRSLKQIHGYQIYMNKEADLHVKGIPAIISNNYIPLLGQKWHIISYLPQVSIPASYALSSLIDSNLVLVKNAKGEIYYPGYGINDLTAFQAGGVNGSMNPGEAYIICVRTNDTLKYPVNGTTPTGPIVSPIAGSKQEQQQNKQHASLLSDYDSSYFTPLSQATGSSSVYVINAEFFNNGDEVAVVSKNGFIYGAGTVIDNNAVITVWGNNTASENIDGAIENESLVLHYYNVNQDTEHELQIAAITEIVTGAKSNEMLAYQQNQLLKIQVTEGSSLLVNENTNGAIQLFPNPAKDLVNLKYNIAKAGLIKIEICNIQGDCVQTLQTEKYTNAGQYAMQINTSNLSIGVYPIKISGNGLNLIELLQVVR